TVPSTATRRRPARRAHAGCGRRPSPPARKDHRRAARAAWPPSVHRRRRARGPGGRPGPPARPRPAAPRRTRGSAGRAAAPRGRRTSRAATAVPPGPWRRREAGPRRWPRAMRGVAFGSLRVPRRVRELQRLVVLERMFGRGLALGQRQPRERLEIGDARIAPPLRLLALDRQETLDLVVAFGIHMPAQAVPGALHPLHLGHAARI